MAIASKITVTTSGTPVQGPDVAGVQFFIEGDPTNTGYVSFNDTSAGSKYATGSGYILNAGQQVVLDQLGNLNTLYFDASANGQIVRAVRVR